MEIVEAAGRVQQGWGRVKQFTGAVLLAGAVIGSGVCVHEMDKPDRSAQELAIATGGGAAALFGYFGGLSLVRRGAQTRQKGEAIEDLANGMDS